MKKVMLLMFVLMTSVSMAAWAADQAPAAPSALQAAPPVAAATVTVYQCPMDKYTSDKAGVCPLCGMNLEEQKMTAADAQAALDKTKDLIKKKA
jgi:hypothetical protein